MRFLEGLRRGRSHVIFVIALAVGGATVVQIEDNTLEAETGNRPAPRADMPKIGAVARGSAGLQARAVPIKSQASAGARTRGAEDEKLLVQAGAYATRAYAEQAGEQMMRDLAELRGVALRVEPHGGLFRARFAVPDRATADAVCKHLVARESGCWVVEG